MLAIISLTWLLSTIVLIAEGLDIAVPEHSSVGAVGPIKNSLRPGGHLSVANKPEAGSMFASVIPSGSGKELPAKSGLIASAFFIKSTQIGNADCAPVRPS